ncbi:hypothetical protein [Methanolobus psychrotolerans]|uniref:hypothetical protein n=1 Tax=Methanolobus psychrotolerans TaxID=1874706 RepID=UPI00101AE0D7|nr:hypothetical protein [Methanolobus psychrotolerans]
MGPETFCIEHGLQSGSDTTIYGSASDKTTLVETIAKIQEKLELNDKVYHIADSAIYSDDNITKLGIHALWITRVPVTLNEVKDFLHADVVMKTVVMNAILIMELPLHMAGSTKSGY